MPCTYCPITSLSESKPVYVPIFFSNAHAVTNLACGIMNSRPNRNALLIPHFPFMQTFRFRAWCGREDVLKAGTHHQQSPDSFA